MSRVGQISIARPGAPLQLEFDERALKRAIEAEAQPGDHVSLYPGNYTIWDEDEEIFVESGVNLTILPGAKVDYKSGFRTQDFAFDGKPTDSTDSEGVRNHPFATGDADRYLRPNFIGHTENIVDLNLGSEWALEKDVEKLRSNFKDFSDFPRFFNINVDGSVVGPLQLDLGDTIELREGSETVINYDSLASGEGVYIEFDANPVSTRVQKVFGGNKIQMRNSKVSGQVTVDHEAIQTAGSPQNQELTLIQSLNVDDGHVTGIETKELAVVEGRKPRSEEGEDGDLWLVEEGGFLRDVYMGTAEPDRLEGKQGDLWFVNDSENSIRDADDIFAKKRNPDPSDGQNGDIWLEIKSGPGDEFVVQEIFIKQRSPTPADGEDNDIWTTLE